MLMLKHKVFLSLILLSSYVSSEYYIRQEPQNVYPSYNSIGQTGLIQLPSADIQQSGDVGFTLGNSNLNEFASIIATPFNGLEATFYYHRPRDTVYLKKGKYLDKGFNLKFSKNFKRLSMAIGLDDIAGTGFLTKEYIVGTYHLDNLNITLGLGTGSFSGDKVYKNPIPGFASRPAPIFYSEKSKGSEIDFNLFFKGPIGLFGGIEYRFINIPRLTFKIENNPFNYSTFMAGGIETYKSSIIRKKDKNYNVGLTYRFGQDYTLSLSQIKGNEFDLSFSKKFKLNNDRPPVKSIKIKKYSKARNKELAFYQDLLRNLEKDNIYMQAAELNEDNLSVALVNNKYNNPIDLLNHSNIVANKIAEIHDIPLSNIEITHVISGIETGTIIMKSKNFLNPQKMSPIKYEEPTKKFKNYTFQTILDFPETYFKVSPNLFA